MRNTNQEFRKAKQDPNVKLMLAAGPKLTHLMPGDRPAKQDKPANDMSRPAAPQQAASTGMSTVEALAKVFFNAPAAQSSPAANVDPNAAAAQKGVKKHTTERSYFENGMIRSETPLVDGIRHGRERVFFANGNVQIETPWVKGYKEGVEKQYFENGGIRRTTSYRLSKKQGADTEYFEQGNAIRRESYYTDDIIDGTQREFYPNGTIKNVNQYEHGDRHGISSTFTSQGAIMNETPYVHNIIHGVARSYYSDGQLNHETPFQNGVKHGVEKWFYISGKIQRVAFYQDGELNGTRKMYYENGYIESETTFSDGKKNGWDREYYSLDTSTEPESEGAKATQKVLETSGVSIIKPKDENGDRKIVFMGDDEKRGLMKHEAFYNHGEPEGLERTYYDNGNVETEGNAVNGFWEGIAKTYYESGVIHMESNFKAGVRVGEERHYSLAGHLKFIVYYDENGKPFEGKCACGKKFTQDQLDAFYNGSGDPTCDHRR